jgi:hypothetical protein
MKVHMRRGHFRKTKDGKTIYVAPHSVAGNFLFDDVDLTEKSEYRSIDDEWIVSRTDPREGVSCL